MGLKKAFPLISSRQSSKHA